jgi:hypothetical protein
MPSLTGRKLSPSETSNFPEERRPFKPFQKEGKLISLQFGQEVDPVVRARMSYAFRMFAVIYGYQIQKGTAKGEISCYYGDPQGAMECACQLLIRPRYKMRESGQAIPVLKKVFYAGEEIVLVHGVGANGEPDWLGEMFEWLSGSLELPIRKSDEAGRIPYSEMVFEKQAISPLRPHAAILMAWLENAMQNGDKVEALAKPPSPVRGLSHMVICSHDIDFCFTNHASALARLSKNLGIAAFHYRSPSFFASNLKMILQTLAGKRVGEYLPDMLSKIEAAGFRSTLFAVAGGIHRRDPNYKIEQISAQLGEAGKRGFSIGLHGSYESVVKNRSLLEEKKHLSRNSGQRIRGNRQHWLRFSDHSKLYAALHNAKMIYDSSLGFAETCGFRNGANFAFPPYDFSKEQPCDFLEIPLVIMDGSLLQMSLRHGTDPQQIADELLGESRKWGWGGISVLWHNPMEAIQMPKNVNEVFWECSGNRRAHGEEWMSADEFLKHSLPRYQAAGFLQGVRVDA